MPTVKLESPEDRYIRIVLEAFTEFVMDSAAEHGRSLTEKEAREHVQRMIEEREEG